MNFEQGFRFSSGASDRDLDSLCEYAGRDLPSAYERFLRFSDGADGWVGQSFVRLWSVEELLADNRRNPAPIAESQLLFFGADGGSEAYAFDMLTPDWAVVMVPLMGEREEALPFAPSFGEFFVALLASGEDLEYPSS